MQKFAIGYFWFLTVTFLAIGLALVIAPEGILKNVDVQFETPTARSDIRADYGGCVLGITCFLAICGMTGRVKSGLLCVGLILLGYASGRLYSLAVDGTPKSIIYYLLAFELVTGTLAVYLSRLVSARGEKPKAA